MTGDGFDQPWIEDDERSVLRSMLGQTIANIEPHWSGSGWDDRNEWLGGITITFDDGSAVDLGGWGHDYWGLHVDRSEP